MADALKVELRLLGVDKTVADMRRVSKEMQQLESMGGSGLGNIARMRAGGGSYVQQRQEAQQMRGFDKIASEMKQIRTATGGRDMSKAAQVGAEGAEYTEALTGLEAMAGPLAVVVAGLTLLGAAASKSAETLTRNADAYYMAGGTARENARGAQIGGAAGMDVKEFARYAMDYSREISPGSGSPFARVDAMRIGNQDSMNPYVSADDKMTAFLRAVEHVTGSGISDTEARREARNNPSLQPFLNLRDLSEGRRRELMSPGGKLERMFSPQARADAAEYNLTISEISQAWQSFVVEVGRPVMRAISEAGREWQLGMKVLDDVRQGHFREAWKDLQDGGSPQRAAQTAMEAHTKAMQDHTLALNNPQMFGGGERTRGAVPGAYSGYYNDPNAQKSLAVYIA